MFSTVVLPALAVVIAFATLGTPGGPKTGDVMRLWKDDAPYSKGSTVNDIPTLTSYIPTKPNGTAIVVCPGGGYWGLADHEGKDYAEYLAQNGITCFVLRYRLGQFQYRHPAMLADAQRAIRTVRSMAPDLGLKTIGIMGSSAGGHLSATASVHYDMKAYDAKDAIDKLSARPDFSVLCYPVISFVESYAHTGSAENLLGKDASMDLKKLLTPSLHVNSKTPPAFLWHTLEDKGVPMENSEEYARALRKVNVPYELHIYEKGNHGIGLQDKAPYTNVHPWAKDLLHWLARFN